MSTTPETHSAGSGLALDGLEPGSPALDVIRQAVREELAASQSPLLSREEAMLLTKHLRRENGTVKRQDWAFDQWCRCHGIRTVDGRYGVYHREPILRALLKRPRRGSRKGGGRN